MNRRDRRRGWIWGGETFVCLRLPYVSYCGQSLAEAAEGESSPQEGLTWDSVAVVGLEGSGLGEREDKLVVLWKSKLLQRLLFEDFHDHKPS